MQKNSPKVVENQQNVSDPQNPPEQQNNEASSKNINYKMIQCQGNITFIVLWIILMSLYHVILFMIYELKFEFLIGSLGNITFVFCVWKKNAQKIERATSSVRYFILFFISYFILSIINQEPCRGLWSFILFETLLISVSNKEKKMKFFLWRLSGKYVFILSILYYFFLLNYDIIYVVIYTILYKHFLINKFIISDETIEKIENWYIIRNIKNIKIFISIKTVMEKMQKAQTLVQDNINNSEQNGNNSSFVPTNVYNNQSREAPVDNQQVNDGNIMPSEQI